MDILQSRTIKTYNKYFQDYNRKTANYTPLEERNRFTAAIQPKGHILDAGCGPGRDCGHFCTLEFNVTGVDLSENLLQIARVTFPDATFSKQDLRKLRFPKSSFHGIWACASLIHLKRSEVPEVIRSFYRILRSGGTLFILVKNGKGNANVAYNRDKTATRFFTYFRKSEMKQILEDAGFVMIELAVWDQKDRWNERPHEKWISGFAQKP